MLSKKAEEQRKKIVWKTAMTDASHQGGNLRVQWEKLYVVDPIIYNFQTDFGFALKSLRLVGIHLQSVPEDLGDCLQGLNVLSLSSNELVHIPDSIVRLTQLTELNLVQNKLVKLPAKIGLMCSLETLLISSNRLVSLPITFGALNLLQLVDLGCNHMRVLPENLDNMTSCRTLNLNNNKLIRLPRCLASMPSLTHLSASNNELTYIPYELMSSHTITTIRLNANKIALVPERIGDMIQLKELCLDYNKLTRLPVSFWKLQALTMLRVEGNVDLVDPPPEVVLQGAARVVEHCRHRHDYDKMGRMRTIIMHMQSALEQAHEYMLTDPALFETGVVVDSTQKDPWYALQMSHFWEDLLPKLKSIWRQLLNKGHSSSSLYEITAFPYSERELLWALSNFSDAYGPVFRQQEAMFLRCSCTDPFTGKRKPCVPPKMGYMCSRMSTLIKAHIVRQRDKEDRTWMAYKASGVKDAEKRAEVEARQYLESGPGRHWLTDTAYSQAEEMLEEGNATRRVTLRSQLAAKRKKEIVERYDKKKQKIEKVRDRKIEALQAELGHLKEDRKRATEGYMQNAIEQRIDAITRKIATLPEMVAIQALVTDCEFECSKVNEEAMESDSQNSSELDSSEFSSDDDTEAARRWRFRLGRYRERERDRELVRWAKREAHARKMDQREEKRDKLAEEGDLGGAVAQDALLGLTNFVTVNIKQGMVDPAVESITRNARSLHKKTRRVAKHIADVAAMRVHRMLAQFDGTLEEIKREMEYELHHQYIAHHVGLARKKAEREFSVIDSVREGRLGLGRDKAFLAWKKWVWTKRTRERRDIRRRWKMATKGFDAGMASVDSAQQQVDQWIPLVDIYSDTPFWRHEVTGDVTYDKPSIRHYLPPMFDIPDPPEDLPAHITVDSSSEDGSSENDWLRKGEALRRRRGAQKRRDEQLRQDNYVSDEDSISDDNDSDISEEEDEGNDNNASVGSGPSRSGKAPAFFPRLPAARQSPAPPPPQVAERPNALAAAGNARDGTTDLVSVAASSVGECDKSVSEESRFVARAVKKARDYMKQSQAYMLRAAKLKLPEVVKTNLASSVIQEEMKQAQDIEYETAFKLIRRKRNQLSTVRHNTYMNQMNRKHNKTFEQLQEEQRQKLCDEQAAIPEDVVQMHAPSAGDNTGTMGSTDGNRDATGSDTKVDNYGALVRTGTANPNSAIEEERLLALAGGDFNMVGTGKLGMELRTVLAQRALHVRRRLHEQAVEKGEAAPKKNVFLKTEILPFFQKSYHASSSEEDEEDEQYKRKKERRTARARMKQQRRAADDERDQVVQRFREKRLLQAEGVEL